MESVGYQLSRARGSGAEPLWISAVTEDPLGKADPQTLCPGTLRLLCQAGNCSSSWVLFASSCSYW